MGKAEWRAKTDARKAAGTIPVAAPKGVPARFSLDVLLPCRFRGEATGNAHKCPACGGKNVMVNEFACSVHGVCTIARLVPGVACCRICDDRPTS